MGLGQNNCGGFCCKAGLGHYAALFKANPERYKHFEEEELSVYAAIGGTYPFFYKTENKIEIRLTLRDYRINYLEKNKVTEDELTEFGGCGCAI